MRAIEVRAESAPLVGFARLLGAALLAGTAGIHEYLWGQGYRDIRWIGPLFLANAILAGAVALAVLLAPRRAVAVVAVAGALLELGTLGGLLLSVSVGLLGFHESWRAPLAVSSAAVEAAGALVLCGLAVVALPAAREAGSRQWGRRPRQ